jgi:hypothetical protein
MEDVEEAIAAGSDLNQYMQVPETGADAYPLLVYAAGNGHRDSVQKLIDAGCDKNATSEWKQRGAVYVAAESGHTEILRYLLENGCDCDSKDGNGRTPMYIASMTGHCECVQLLVAYGATVSEDILLVAAANGHRATVDMLLAAGNMHMEDVRERGSAGGSKGGSSRYGGSAHHMTVADAFELHRQRQHQASHGTLFTAGFMVFLASNCIFLYGEVVDDMWENTRLDPYDW